MGPHLGRAKAEKPERPGKPEPQPRCRTGEDGGRDGRKGERRKVRSYHRV